MNRIAPTEKSETSVFDVLIDGRRLAEHFIGRRGARPSMNFVLGGPPGAVQEALGQLLGQHPSELESGRVPVLVCEECGDIGCGALAVRIERRDGSVVWSDWAYENGYEPPRALDWPEYPEVFEFELQDYESVLSSALLRA